MPYLRYIAGIVLTLGLTAATVPVQVVGITQTQITISYVPTILGACTLAATNLSTGVPAYDLNPALWTGADQDISRTVSNGFRWPVLLTGSSGVGAPRTVTLGGHGEVKKGLDGALYSTAYELNAPYRITVQCGADSGAVTVSTANRPQGMTWPEVIIPDITAPIPGKPVPTIDYVDRSKWYIDPITGVAFTRLSSMTDIPRDPMNSQLFIWALASGWSNTSSAIDTRFSGETAFTSTVNAPLFLAWPNIDGYGATTIDVQAHLYAASSGSPVTISTCITEDSGQTCASSIIDTLIGTPISNHDIPSNYPKEGFAGWGPWSKPFGGYDTRNRNFSGVGAAGSVVTMPSLVEAGFNTDRPAGSKLQLISCTEGSGPYILTVANSNSPTSITVQETGLSLHNCTYQDLSAGLRVWLKTAGTVSLSATFDAAAGYEAFPGSNGERNVCNRTKASIVTDCDGVTHSPPILGQICQLDENHSPVYLVQDNGRACLQDQGYKTSGTGALGLLLPIDNPFIPNDPTGVMAADSNGKLYFGVFNNGTNFSEFTPTAQQSGHYTWTQQTPPPSLATQLAARGGPQAAALATGVWGSPGLGFVIDGHLIYSYFPGAGDAPEIRVSTTPDGILETAYDTFTTYPMAGGCASHSGHHGTENFSPLVCNPLMQGSNLNFGGGPFELHMLGQVKNGVLYQYTVSATGGTAGTPTLLTVPNNDFSISVAPGWITCSGGTGGWTAVNTQMRFTKIDNNTISLPVATTGSYSGTITCTATPPLLNAKVNGVADNGGGVARVTVAVQNPGVTSSIFGWDSANHHLQDGDSIAFGGLAETAQYFVKASCAGCSTVQFDVYKDIGLTTPASATEINPANGGIVNAADMCPAVSTFPYPWYYDSGYAGKVRCVTYRLDGLAACSDYATSAEHGAYPCPQNPSNTARSSLKGLAIGDGFRHDNGDSGSGHPYELFVVVGISSNDVTFMRWYGNDPNWGADTHAQADNKNVHAAGWMMMTNALQKLIWANLSAGPVPVTSISNAAPPIVTTGMAHAYTTGDLITIGGDSISAYNVNYKAITVIDSTHFSLNGVAASGSGTGGTAFEPVYVQNDAFASAHGDTSPTPKGLNYAGAWPGETKANGGNPDSIPNTTPAAFFAATPMYTHRSAPLFSRNTDNTSYSTGGFQTYANHRQSTAPDSEQAWNFDAIAMNQASGNPQGSIDGGMTRTLVKQAGTNYVYKISTNAPSGINLKVMDVLVGANAHRVYTDMSSAATGDVITDSNMWRKCQAFKATECRHDSIPGDIFIVETSMYDPGHCSQNNLTLATPCALALWGGAGWYLQIRQAPLDLSNSGSRYITRGFSEPYGMFSYSTMVASPDGLWGFTVLSPLQRTNPPDMASTDWWRFKLPPWPQQDSVDRTTYVNVPVDQAGSSGDTVRAAFGYAENGDPASSYCTSRQEACYTTATPTQASPFLFANETQNRVACSSGCQIQIPAIAGRTLYYRILLTHNGTEIVGPVQVVALL